MKSSSFFIIALITSILSCRSDKKLTVNDLILTDIREDAIRKNEVDSTFVLVKVKNQIQDDNPYSYKNLNFTYIDSLQAFIIEKIYYNSRGQIQNTRLEGPFGGGKIYQYDSLGLIISKETLTDFKCQFTANHQFISEENKLYSYWCQSNYPSDTSYIKFDINGRKILSISKNHDDKENRYKQHSKYWHDTHGKIIKITTHIDDNNHQKIESSYFLYERKSLKTQIDSTFNSKNQLQFLTTSHFDKRGLISQSVVEHSNTNVLKEELIYLHFNSNK